MLVQGQNLIGARLKLFDRVCRSNRILVNGLWFMVFNATFKNISVILWRQFYWWRKPEYEEKTIFFLVNNLVPPELAQ